MVDTDDGRRTTPWVWHKLPTGELIIDYKLRSDIIILNDNLEAVFIEINKTQFATPNNIIIGTVYQPPNTDIQLFMHHLKLILDQMDKEGKCVYLMKALT